MSILDSEHEFDGTDAHYMKRSVATAPVTIGAQTMIGLGTVVLAGVEIGANCAVGANSLVRAGSYADGSLIAGNPARRIRDLGSASEA
jgi:acetyltransferase-like isoleucine patch superfamily enzyme